jgi:SAM-dependent methyltransferase
LTGAIEITAPNPKDIVRDGYDRISYEYRDDDGCGPDEDHPGKRGPRPAYEEWLSELIPQLRDGDPVLDLGCGCGVPVTKLLGERFRVTGVDISPVQIDRARKLVPKARFLVEDMTIVGFDDESFAAVVSFFALIHVPLEEQREILRKLYRWLRRGGWLLATVGARSWTGIDPNWHGAPMYWSHADRETYFEWLAAARFRIIWDRFIPEGTGGHTLLLARK